MKSSARNRFIFQGEIIEVIHTSEYKTYKIICKPGSIIIETDHSKDYDLGDLVMISGTIEPDLIELDQKNPISN